MELFIEEFYIYKFWGKCLYEIKYEYDCNISNILLIRVRFSCI